MLVSHTHKFIYSKTFKTASTSVEIYFEIIVCLRGNGLFLIQQKYYDFELDLFGYTLP